MTTSRTLVFSVFLSGLVFTSATLLLMATGSRPITIEVEERPLFTGRVQDLATPYLSVVTGLSIGVGLASFALIGWRNASQELEQLTEQVAILKQQLQQQEGMVESFKFSEARLQATGLNFFLETPSTHAATHTSTPVASLNASPSQPFPVASNQPQPVPAHPAAAGNPAHAQNHVQTRTQTVETLLVNHSQPKQQSQIEELKLSLKQIMHQIEQLQTAQSSTNESVDTSVRI